MPYVNYPCPQCSVSNYVHHGDPNDCTSYWGEPACVCWNCKFKYWIAEIDNEDIRMELESYDDYDPSKSTDENLVNAGAEDGRPTEEYYSAEYEHFLDEDSISRGTWRGFLLERLKFINGGDPFWGAKRPRRCELLKLFLQDPTNWNWNEDIAKAFEKSEINCLKDYKTKEVDWINYYRKLRDLLLYMTATGDKEVEFIDPPRKPGEKEDAMDQGKTNETGKVRGNPSP